MLLWSSFLEYDTKFGKKVKTSEVVVIWLHRILSTQTVTWRTYVVNFQKLEFGLAEMYFWSLRSIKVKNFHNFFFFWVKLTSKNFHIKPTMLSITSLLNFKKVFKIYEIELGVFCHIIGPTWAPFQTFLLYFFLSSINIHFS